MSRLPRIPCLFAAATVVAFVAAALVPLHAQGPAPAVTSSVSAPASVACAAPFSSSVTLNGYNNETPGTADIIFVMDESGSINAQEWQQLDAFVDATIDLLDLGNSGNRVALVKYSSTAQVALAYTSNAAVAKGIPRTYPGGGTATHIALQTARNLMLAQARPDATKFIIVLTDGFCSCTMSDLNNQSRAAEAAGATMIAVGVDGARIQELDTIGTDIDGVATSLFVANFEELEAAVSTLIQAIVTPGATDVTVVVDAMPRFPVTGASATAGTVAVAGSQVVWTLPSLGSASQTLTIDHQHDGTGNGPLQVFSATYSDAQMHLVDIDTPSTTVTGCNVAPVANAGNDQSVSATGPATAVALDGSGSTDDGLIQPLSYAWSSDTGVVASGVAPVVMLPVGTHTFTLTVFDGEFSDSDTAVVTVTDTTAPEIDSVTPSTGMLWPPNHRMVPVSVTVAATDNVDAAPMCTITGVTSSEADNGRGDGNTTEDAVITGPLTVELRSERSGRGAGRTYTIEVTCTDAAGNASTGTTIVTAPKSQGR